MIEWDPKVTFGVIIHLVILVVVVTSFALRMEWRVRENRLVMQEEMTKSLGAIQQEFTKAITEMDRQISRALSAIDHRLGIVETQVGDLRNWYLQDRGRPTPPGC